MKAVVVSKDNNRLVEVSDIGPLRPIKNGEALVDIAYCGGLPYGLTRR